jgi:hypothetical protein
MLPPPVVVLDRDISTILPVHIFEERGGTSRRRRELGHRRRAGGVEKDVATAPLVTRTKEAVEVLMAGHREAAAIPLAAWM